MLKARIIALLPIQNGRVVQSFGFSRYLPVGHPAIAVEALDRWGIDEIVMVDINAGAEQRCLDTELVRGCARVCHVPLTAGGGISNVKEMERLVHAGADKLAVNSRALTDPGLLRKGAELFGSQCMVASIDARRLGEQTWIVHTNTGISVDLTPWEAALRAEEQGAGEILLQSVDRDGTRQGYDLELARRVCDAVSIPVILAGGAGHPKHFLEGLKHGLAAVAAGNIFHHSEMSVIQIKRYLIDVGFSIRLDSYATFEGSSFDATGRITKRPDEDLEQLRFQFIPDEII